MARRGPAHAQGGSPPVGVQGVAVADWGRLFRRSDQSSRAVESLAQMIRTAPHQSGQVTAGGQLAGTAPPQPGRGVVLF